MDNTQIFLYLYNIYHKLYADNQKILNFNPSPNNIPKAIGGENIKKRIDNKYFTSIEEWKKNNFKKISILRKTSFISGDGGWVELNNSWYLNKRKHPNKFFNNFNTFMNFIFKSYINPEFIRFCPGANYIIPRNNILKYDLVFYKNLKYIINYAQLSGESHILERALFSIWNSEYKVTDIMKKPFNEDTIFPKKENFFKAKIKNYISRI